MPSTTDLIRSGAATVAAGGTLDSNTIESNPGATVSTGESEFVTGQESTNDDYLVDGESESPEKDPLTEDSSETASSDDKKTVEASDRETITVTDDKGRRRKVEIDFSDRKAVKKAFELMHGSRKWQAERDQARQEVVKEREAKFELKKNWDALEVAFQQNGVGGVIDLLEGKQGAYQAWEKKAIERARFLDNASPEEVQALEARESAESSKRELARIRKENEEFRKEMSQKEDQAQLKSLESRINPVFEKYRFADKLGDETDEHMFDDMLWNTALKRLQPYEDQGLDITSELVEREIRSVAASIRKRINVQAEKKTSRVLDQKKQEALTNVQTKLVNGYKQTGGAAKEAKDLIESRNLTGLLKNWGKYGSVFNK